MMLHSSIWVRQAGGKYGKFVCPSCGDNGADWKFTQSSGWCDNCSAAFIMSDPERSNITREGISRIFVEIIPNMDDSACPPHLIDTVSRQVERAIDACDSLPKEAQRHYLQLLSTVSLSALSTAVNKDEMRIFLEDSLMVLTE